MPSIINNRSDVLRTGQMLGRYELLMPIANGGMGDVWAARLKGTRGFRKLVAVKTILRNLENAQAEQMLFQEATLASQIHHPNVAETFELGEHDGTLYLVMELVEGESLRFMLGEAQATGGIPLPVSVNLVGQVCRGLAAAHDLRGDDGQRVGLIHRDISPPNVLVTDAGTVKIVDFGVATTASSATCGSGEIKGKISYLSPEQLRGEALDARVDVFATGILLYLLTVGRHPFRCASESATIARILSDAPAVSPSAFVENYPDALEQVVMRALDKQRATRFASITELLEALEDACPSAFGPRADELVTSHVHRLTKNRLHERRATLRIAEEWAESSSSRHSVSSLPAVTASAAPPIKSSHAALFGMGGMLTGLAVAAVGATVYFGTRGDAPGAFAGGRIQVASPPVTHGAPLVAGPASQRFAESQRTGSAVEAPEAVPPELTAESARRPKTSASEHNQRSTPDRAERELEHETAKEPIELVGATEGSWEHPAEIPAEPATQYVAPTAQPPVVVASLPALPTPALASPPPAPPGPRLLPSKLGHRQLLTNPSSNPVVVPSTLQRSGQSFSATVNICVGPMGQVAKVSIIRSAGPALDPQIVQLLSSWRYRPLTEGGRATPFCYPLKYQVESAIH